MPVLVQDQVINDDDRKGGAQKFQGAGTGFGFSSLRPMRSKNHCSRL